MQPISLFPEKLQFSEKLKDILLTLLYLSFIIFSTDILGIYYMVSLVVLIYSLHLIFSSGRIQFHFGIYHYYILGVALFSLLSSTWAINPYYALEKSITFIEILIMMSLLYEAYYYASIHRLLNILMWAGFLLSIYTIVFVGLDSLEYVLANEDRLENSFANVNVIGMCCSISILLAIYFWRFSKNILNLILCIPTIIVVAGSGSRKALIILIIGIILIFFFQQRKSKGNIYTIFKFIGSAILVIGLFFLISKTGIFGGSLERMGGLIDSFTGGNEADSSSLLRAYYQKIGFEQFLKTPILGIGMGNARILALKYTGNDCYLHSNYAEIAANGGIIGLIIIYWIYIYIFLKGKKLVKYDKFSGIILLLAFLQVLLDYGNVSYYSKETYFMFMIFCLYINKHKFD